MSFAVMLFLLAIVCIFVCEAHVRCANNHLQPRVAVGFFGISRSLNYVLRTFQKRVFDVLDRAFISYDVFLSANAAFETTNTRGVHGTAGGIDPFDVRLLEPCLFTLIDQEDVRLHEWQSYAKSHDIELDADFKCNITKYGHLDIFEDGFESVKNVLCAYHSQKILIKMIQTHQLINKLKYDAVLVLRLDTAVVRDIDLPEHLKTIQQEPHSIWIPDFQHFGGYNDRAAFGSVNAMSIYLKRGGLFRDSANNSDVSEPLVKSVLVQHNVTVHWSTMRVMRVRQQGVVAEAKSFMNISDAEWERCIVHVKGAPLKLSGHC